VFLEGLAGQKRFPRLARVSAALAHRVESIMMVFIIAGVVLSCAHQSSLGNLMVIAPTKTHPLWWSPMLPALFLMSAIAGGLPMVIVESLLASRALKLQPETALLSRLARYIPILLGVYGAAKIVDVLVRGVAGHLVSGSAQGVVWLVEVGAGVVLPLALLSSHRVRESAAGLLTSSLLVVLGVAMNRVDVFLVAFRPVTADHAYVPAITEVLVTVGLVATLVLVYRVIVTWLPVVAQPAAKGVSHVSANADSDGVPAPAVLGDGAAAAAGASGGAA